MTFTRNFPNAEYYTDARGNTVRNDNATIDARRGDTSHPVLEGTQEPDWDAFRTVDQLRDAIGMHGAAWQAPNPTEVQRMRLEKTTGWDLCTALFKLGSDAAAGLEVLERGQSNRFNPGTAELCTEALEVWNRVLEAEARFATTAN